jgi:hypothetical protein
MAAEDFLDSFPGIDLGRNALEHAEDHLRGAGGFARKNAPPRKRLKYYEFLCGEPNLTLAINVHDESAQGASGWQQYFVPISSMNELAEAVVGSARSIARPTGAT